MPEIDIHNIIIDMEREALGRWMDGDPQAYMDILAPEVTCFHPSQKWRSPSRYICTNSSSL
jgi:hypothetical protein